MVQTSKKKKKKRIITGIVIGIIIIGVVLAIIFKPEVSEYTEAQAKSGNIETYYTFSGVVESKNSQNVMANSVMQISDIKVSEGDVVEKDDVLFKTSVGQEIKAQISGTVSEIYVSEDEQVMAGALLCDIYDFNNLQVSVKVDEYDLSSITEGKEVTVNIGALDLDVTGVVSSISDTAVNQQGVAYFTAVIDLPADPGIKIGMTAEARILNKQALGVLTIPMSSIQFDDEENTFVYIKDAESKIISQSVTIGINDGINVEITGGLSEGQKIYYIKTDTSTDMSGNGFRQNNTANGEE